MGGFTLSGRVKEIALGVVGVVAVVAFQLFGSLAAEGVSLKELFHPSGKVEDGPRPTPAAATSQAPLGMPPLMPVGEAPYKFLYMQPDSLVPVGFDPCRTVNVVLNEQYMPPGGAGVIQDALAEVQALTGLVFKIEGATAELPSLERRSFQPELYGDRWAPVLIGWLPGTEANGLGGDYVGWAGSRWTEVGGAKVYVTGQVALDADDMAPALNGSFTGRNVVVGIVRHELAHLVGLDHVDDKGQVMYPQASSFDFGLGDKLGLWQLGNGPCVPSL